MNIELNVLKEVINSEINEVKNEMKGIYEPTLSAISKSEAIDKLGVISSIVINLHDRVQGDKLKEEVWELKKEADSILEELLSRK